MVDTPVKVSTNYNGTACSGLNRLRFTMVVLKFSWKKSLGQLFVWVVYVRTMGQSYNQISLQSVFNCIDNILIKIFIYLFDICQNTYNSD